VDSLCVIEVVERKLINSELKGIRILQVIDTLEVGGAEYVFADLIERYTSDFNYDVLIIRDKIEEDLKNKILNFTALNRKSKLSFLSALKLHQLAKNYDILHVHLRHTFRYVAWARLIFSGKYRIILHDHTGNIDLTFNQPPFFEYKLIKPDYYIGVSNKLKNWSQVKWGINNNKCRVLVNLPFLKFERVFDTARSKNQDKKTDTLIHVANIKPIKNQAFAIAFARSIERKIDFYGNIQDELYFKSSVEPYLQKNNLELFQNFVIDNTIICEYSFGLCTSISESGPMVLIEYLMSGIPFIAYRTGEIAEHIYETFPEFFMDNWDIMEWKIRYNQIANYNLNTEENTQKIKILLNKYFNADVYKEGLADIYSNIQIN
jgi:glycosyltransferase involved in cell wall biosynthesis